MLTREMMAVLGDWHERLETDLAGLESYEDSMLDRHRLEVGALRAALDTLRKLPVTADGVAVGPDDTVYFRNYNDIVQATMPVMAFGPEPVEGRGQGLYWSPRLGYSTASAARQAIQDQNPEQQAGGGE
ncbi:MAG: hypothetical protein HRU13_14315 [Phycisphaerales bacterium]|nr:hypothetical protein [Phycisphaerales bacterium]